MYEYAWSSIGTNSWRGIRPITSMTRASKEDLPICCVRKTASATTSAIICCRINSCCWFSTLLLCEAQARLQGPRRLDPGTGRRLLEADQCREGFLRSARLSVECTRTRDTEPSRTRVMGTSAPAAPKLQILR